MKSKLTFSAYLVIAGCIIQAVSFPVVFSEAISGFRNTPFSSLLVSSFFLFFWVAFFFSAIKTSIVSVKIYGGEIFIKRYCGLGIEWAYNVGQIDGFKTLILSGRGKASEFLYLTVDGREIAILSEYYHSNYEHLKKQVIENGIKYLGVKEQVGMIGYLKKVFGK